jgi:gliding motility-associated-like protein
MMSQMNYTDSSTPLLAKAARFPLLRTLLAGCLLLLLGYSPAVMGQMSVSTPKNYQLANNSAQDLVVVTISPIPSPSVGVTFVINGGSGGDPVIYTDAFGNATLPLTSPTVTSYPVLAEIVDPVTNVATIIGTVTVYFVAAPGPVDLSRSYITVVQNPAAADGVSQDIVEAILFDANGVPEPNNTPVNFTIQIGTATITATGKTVGNQATAYFTSTVVGNVQVQAQVATGFLNDRNNPLNNFVSIQFVVPPPSLAKSYVVAVTTPMPADGSSQDVVQAGVYNSLGQPVPDGTVVTFSVNNGSDIMTTTGVTVNGIATAYFTSLVPNTAQVQAQVSISGVPTFLNDQSNPANNFVTIQFVIPPPSLAKSYVVAVTTPMPADGSSQDVVQAGVYNSLGQPVPDGTVVTFSVNTGNDIMTTTGVTVNGIATAYFTSLVVGSAQVQAQVSISGVPTFLNDQNNPANNYVTIKFVVGPPVPSNPIVVVPPGGGGGGGGSGTGPSNPSDPSGPGGGFTYLAMTFNNVPADGVSADTATAYITDAEGHPVPGVVVTFTFHTGGPANSGASFQPGGVITITVTTNQNGYAAVPITGTVPGDAWIDASINPGGTINGSSAIAHFTDTPDLTNPQTQLVVIIYEALADGHSTTEVKAHVVDHSGQPMADVAVVFAIDSGNAQIITTGPYTTDANGDVFIQLTSTTPGNVLVTATIAGKAITFGSPARVYFAAINIYVPRVFTPNNDGTNDILKPILVGISTFHYFSVYNRWGNLIYTSQDPNQGWDGTFKGVAQPVETYLWIAEGIDLNGKKIVAKGMTSLVR